MLHLQAVLDAVDGAVAWSGADGRIEGCNAAFAALAGRAPESLRGAALSEVLEELGRGARELETVSSPAGEGRVVTVRDASAAAEAARRESEVLSYSVVHDLRAPLRAINGFTQLLLESSAGLSDEQKEHLRRTRSAGRNMTRLIDGVLTFLSVSRGEAFRQETDLSAEALAAAEALRKGEPERRVEFVIQPGLKAAAAPGLVRELLEQLLRNSWKFTSPHPAARIEFGAAAVDGQAAYFVRDDGVGFDPLYAGKLFAPFQRLHSGAEFAGNGLGLAIARRIAALHGGRIWAESGPGPGAVFYFTLGPAGA